MKLCNWGSKSVVQQALGVTVIDDIKRLILEEVFYIKLMTKPNLLRTYYGILVFFPQ
jgi:hypothetical protein